MADLLETARLLQRTTQDKISNTVKNITNDIVNDSLYALGSLMDFSSLWNTPIERYCLIEMADRQKIRLMRMNFLEKNVTLAKLGDSVSGVSNHVSDEAHLYDYSYTEGNNYLHDYQMMADKTTTQTKLDSNNFQTYDKEGHNTLYGITMNAYYDDNDSGEGKFGPSRKIEYYDANRNRNSILNKTKQMFRERKINTIISRFHTDNERLQHNETSETARSVYGLSHGRNLLTYDAERYGESYNRNGYDNPYCRVWTHHHQYSEYRTRLMRPFYIENDNGTVTTRTNGVLHKWDDFPDMNVTISEASHHFEDVVEGNLTDTDTDVVNGQYVLPTLRKTRKKVEDPAKEVEWGWKDSGSDGWKHSVLNSENGLVNIAPKFLGGAYMNIHTKDCMFSIENLAWQGYDPYSFERALSWEQRGPFGGRIMWFPPYGLQFNEDTSVNWNEHSFIGRGENVFTYANTSRSGTLSFMMVVDHPSILDYATWHDPKDLKDTDVFRFFAGCDSSKASGGGSGSNGILQSFARKTPLTDEYLEQKEPSPVYTPEMAKTDNTEEQKLQDEIPTPDEEITISFYVFFPNNYSGYFDRKKSNSVVEPIAFLLAGEGAGWKCNVEDVTKSQSLPTSFDYDNGRAFLTGEGYEMNASKTNKTAQDGSNNFIIGTGNPNGYGETKYIQNNDKRWYYRIDGEYVAGIKYDSIENTFGQTLSSAKSYEDETTYGLNCNIVNIAQLFELTDQQRENTYTLAEIACALFNDKQAIVNRIKDNSGNSIDNEKVETLMEYFGKKENKENSFDIQSISCIGYSNSHGSNRVSEINKQRNDFLAEQRRNTVLEWFQKYYGKNLKVDDTEKISDPGQPVGEGENESGKIAKKWRSAKMSIKIKKTTIKSVDKMNQIQNNADSNATIELTEEQFNGLPQEEQGDYRKCYRYVGYTSSVKEIIGDHEYITEEEKNNIVSNLPNGELENSFFKPLYIKYATNIIGQYDIANMSGDEWESQEDNYEPNQYIYTDCDLNNPDENAKLRCDALKYTNFKKFLTKEEFDRLDTSGQQKYTIYTYKKKNDNKTPDDILAEQGFSASTGWVEVGKDDKTGKKLYKNANEKDKDKQNVLWYYDEESYTMKVYSFDAQSKLRNNKHGWDKDNKYRNDTDKSDYNSLRYDQEYHFFKQLEAKHPDVFSSVVEKLQYFDPAFHSMTPEGFMGRLNFLHQCTRQGNTISNSDKNGHMANNLAFGRPPFCILRLGDFYYQKIVIRSINITYDPLVLDLNNEGVGVVPLIANVSISFNFIGGGDLTGPVRRLQNAMSFNYYANGRLYDNRADRVERHGTNETNGNWDTMDMGDVDFKNSYFHHVPLSTK